MRHQRRELGLNGSVMFVVRTYQNPVPVPAAGFRWLNEQQHLTLEEIHGKPTEHALGEEGRVLSKRLENPLVFERLHVCGSRGVAVGSFIVSKANAFGLHSAQLSICGLLYGR